MFELFLNPWFMVLGGALVLLPILIHLINRLRYKRIRWAAMEFLLKSQKRNRRRLIIEQLILLALRCLLVLLVGFLVARLVAGNLGGSHNTLHVVVLDNTASMGDRWKTKDGDQKNAYDAAKELLVKQVAKNAVQASSTQHFRVYLLTDLDQPVFDKKLNDQTIDELGRVLNEGDAREASEQHVPPLKAVQKAREVFATKDVQFGDGVFHFLSDFRERDWGGENGKELTKELEGLGKLAKVYLVDPVDPYRHDAGRVLKSHDNLSLVDLRPQYNVVPATGEPVRFTVTVQNYSDKTFTNVFLTTKVDGTEKAEGSVPLTRVPPGPSTHWFQIGFDKEGFRVVTSEMKDPEGLASEGLFADNKRSAVVEVRPAVDLLVIDGDYPTPQNGPDQAPETSGTFYLKKALTTRAGYRVVTRKLEDLETLPLSPLSYPCVFLLNVPEVKKDSKALANLEKYVQAGGGLCFFLGDKVKYAAYNEVLYNDGQGLFPAPLDDKPRDDDGKGVFIRKATHPMIDSIYKADDKPGRMDTLLLDVRVARYFPVAALKWRKTEQVEEVLNLGNRKEVASYGGKAVELARELPVDDDTYKDHKAQLKYYQDRLINGFVGKESDQIKDVYELGNILRNLLTDPGREPDKEKNDPGQPSMLEFWAKMDQAKDDAKRTLRRRFEGLYEEVRFGDPLMISKVAGRGRVMACLTTAGKAWTPWPEDNKTQTYPIFMQELRQYLAGVSETPSRPVASAVTVELDAGAYEPKVALYDQPEVPGAVKPRDDDDEEEIKDKQAGRVPRSTLVPANKDGVLAATFNGPKKRGLVVAKLFPKAEPGAKAVPERRAYLFNMDAALEGDLRRTPSDLLKRGITEEGGGKGGDVLHGVSDFSALSNRKTDLSESPWLYLLFLVILIAEQALAVHLSFHGRAGDAVQAPPAVAGQIGAQRAAG